MSTLPSRFVLDTSVLVDLERGGVLRQVFALQCKFLAPDLIVDELLDPSGEALISLGLEALELSGVEVSRIIALREYHTAVSTPDLSAFVLAEREGAILLTGDGGLRRLAEQSGLEVHGTLWVLDRLVNEAVLTAREAANALATMLQKSSRLPEDECRRRLRIWRRQR